MTGVPVRHAISADADLLRRLGRGLHGRVHSVFERTVNVEVEGGDLVTLASRGVDNAPDTIVVDIEGFGGIGVSRDDTVHVTSCALRVGHLGVRLDGVSSWSATLPVYPRDAATLRANLRHVDARVRPVGRGPRLRRRWSSGDSFADEAHAVLEQRSTLLQASILGADLDAARVWAASMVGLGTGLTPSGDDFLVGLFTILNLTRSPCHAMRAICGDVVAIARTSTNAISVAALANAACGRVRESIGVLVHELIGGTPEDLSRALDRVLAIGATSGTEIAAGLASGFALNLRMRSKGIRTRARCLSPADRRPLRGTRSTYP